MFSLVSLLPPVNRPFAQLLSVLETGHPAAAGPSPAYDFSVFDERNAVFLVFVLDCFGFFIGFGSSKLKLEPCSSQRVLQKKNRPQLNGKKAEFCAREW